MKKNRTPIFMIFNLHFLHEIRPWSLSFFTKADSALSNVKMGKKIMFLAKWFRCRNFCKKKRGGKRKKREKQQRNKIKWPKEPSLSTLEVGRCDWWVALCSQSCPVSVRGELEGSQDGRAYQLLPGAFKNCLLPSSCRESGQEGREKDRQGQGELPCFYFGV